MGRHDTGARLREGQQATEERIEEAPEEDSRWLASEMGNHAFTALARSEGEGILPDGRVHPAIEGTIAQMRGGGRPVDSAARARMEGASGAALGDVRAHTGPDAHQLARSVQARAFAVGRDLFFAEGEYRPGTTEGADLLTHELAHVAQQADAPTSGPLKVTQPGDAIETEADEIARDVRG